MRAQVAQVQKAQTAKGAQAVAGRARSGEHSQGHAACADRTLTLTVTLTVTLTLTVTPTPARPLAQVGTPVLHLGLHLGYT